MKNRILLPALCVAFVLSMAGPMGLGQESGQTLNGYFTYGTEPGLTPEMIQSEIAAGTTIPLWRFTIVAPLGPVTRYSGVMVGVDPRLPGGTTSVPTYIVPLIIKMPNGSVFNPTVPDVCVPAPGGSDLGLVEASPVLQSFNFVFGTVPVGNTQYIDAFQRANFWQILPGGGAASKYHTLLGVRILPAVKITVPRGQGYTKPGKVCGKLGVLNFSWFDPTARRLILLLRRRGVGPKTFPVLLTGNVVFQSGRSCCILGYHSVFGFPTQTYSAFEFDTTGSFGNATDTSIMAHEVGEWMDDPIPPSPPRVNNLTPPWGHIGQVKGCQNNNEVGDPLSGTNIPVVVMPNGFTYHLQELAFFSWFYRQNPSIGVLGWYSDDGTFLAPQGPCR